MSLPRPKDLDEALDMLYERDLRIKELETEQKHGLTGFLRGTVTEKVLLGVIGLFAMGGVGVGVWNNVASSKERTEIKTATEKVAEKVDDAAVNAKAAAVKVDDVHREIKRVKEPNE